MNQHSTEIAELVDHVVRTLPDSYSGRRTLLFGLMAVLPKSHPARAATSELLDGLVRHELAQREFPFCKSGGPR